MPERRRRPLIFLLPLMAIALGCAALLGHNLEAYQRARIHAATPEPLRPLIAPLVPGA